MVKAKYLCRLHLLGEHVELHLLASNLDKQCAINVYLKKGIIELHNLQRRHDELAEEMLAREYNHQSPLDQFSIDMYIGSEPPMIARNLLSGKVDLYESFWELYWHCERCRGRMNRDGISSENLRPHASADAPVSEHRKQRAKRHSG